MYEVDRALVERMRAGDQPAFDEFFQRHAGRLAAFAARRSSLDRAGLEDVVQNVLIKAVRNLGSYRAEAALFTWLAQICRHELADARRKAARQPGQVSLEEMLAMRIAATQLRVPAHLEPEAELEVSLRSAAVLQVLQALPENYAAALEAKYGDGLSVEAIAQQLGITQIAAQSLLARARDAFRELWRARLASENRGASSQ